MAKTKEDRDWPGKSSKVKFGYIDERGRKIKVQQNPDDTFTPVNADELETDLLPKKEG